MTPRETTPQKKFDATPVVVLVVTVLLIALWQTGVIQLIMASFLKIPPRACCSCLCKDEDGRKCAEGIKGSYASDDCDKVCAKECARLQCVPGGVTKLPEDGCTEIFPLL